MSIWYDMGVRDGQFSGVKPLSAIDAIWNFFNDVRYAVYMSPHIGVYPEEWLWKVGFTFDGRSRFSQQDVDILLNGELKLPLVEMGPDFIGSFISADTWCQAPDWTLDKFIKSDSEALTDDIVLHPLVSIGSYGQFVLAEDFSWYRQRYALIQKLRFLVVPMDIWYKNSAGEWWQEHDNIGEGGYLYNPCNSEIAPCFTFYTEKGVRFSIPDYWAQDGVDFKIGVQIQEDPSNYLPVKGQFWHYDKEYTIETEKSWEGSGVFSAFAVVDLATHPDFEKYYDSPEIIECPSLPGPESYPESSSSSSSIVLPSESQSFTSESKPESESESKPPVTDPCKRYPSDHTVYFTIYTTMTDVETGECYYDFSYAEEAVRSEHHCSVNNIDGTFELYYQSEYVGYYVSYDISTGKFVRGRIDSTNFPPIVAEKPEKPDCHYSEYAVIEIY